jgi:hypothetical protein
MDKPSEFMHYIGEKLWQLNRPGLIVAPYITNTLEQEIIHQIPTDAWGKNSQLQPRGLRGETSQYSSLEIHNSQGPPISLVQGNTHSEARYEIYGRVDMAEQVSPDIEKNPLVFIVYGVRKVLTLPNLKQTNIDEITGTVHTEGHLDLIPSYSGTDKITYSLKTTNLTKIDAMNVTIKDETYKDVQKVSIGPKFRLISFVKADGYLQNIEEGAVSNSDIIEVGQPLEEVTEKLLSRVQQKLAIVRIGQAGGN